MRDKKNKAIFLGITSRAGCHNYDTEYGMNCEYERECCEELNGKIVAECDYEVKWESTYWYCNDFIEYKGLEKSCLTKEQLFDYVKGRNDFYAIHIKDLHIFDEPKKLNEFVTKRCQYAICSSCRYGKDNVKCSTIDNEVDKAPQNMMCCYGVDGKRYVLISIKSEWLCKILNGEKTIEVRKKVLKEMLE